MQTHKPWIIAHRGAKAYAKENTREAAKIAFEMGADILELDVRATEDGILVAHHNRGLRLGRRRFWIDQLTYDEAIVLEPDLVTIEEFIRDFGNNIGFDFDIKQNALEEKTVALLKKYKFKGHVIITSSNFAILWRFKELYPTCATTFWIRTHDSRDFLSSFIARFFYKILPYFAKFIVPRIIVWRVKHRLIDAVSFDPPMLVNEGIVDDLHSQGILVFASPVNKERDAHRLIGYGIDAMITDKPDIIRKIIDGEILPRKRALPVRIIHGIGRRVKRVVRRVAIS